MGKIVFDLKENHLVAKGSCSNADLAKALPSIQQSFLKRFGQDFDQKVSAILLFLAVLSALDEMKVSRDVVMKAFDEAVAFIKEVEEE